MPIDAELPVNALDAALLRELEDIRQQGLWRTLRCVDSAQGPRVTIDGQSLLNFSSNDYLGLANEPALQAASAQAVAQFGAGSGASRLLGGSLRPHHELEAALAAFKGTEAALAFSSGYATALGTIGALLGKNDIIVLDKLVHACLVDAARLCGATIRVFKHNDIGQLARILVWADTRRRGAGTAARKPRILVVTESVFSMDGEVAPLRELVEIKDRYGAWLMLDEAHATGLFGPQRRGLAEAHQVAARVDIQMGTLGKALGAAGGYICGSRALIDVLVNRARSFIFSTAPTPATAAAATAGVRLVQSAEGRLRCARLWDNVEQIKRPLLELDWPVPDPPSAIVPLRIGQETAAVEMAARLRQHQVFVPAIRYPTVARGAARLRLTLTAAHTREDLTQLMAALKRSHQTLSADLPNA